MNDTIYLFKQIAKPVKTRGKYLGKVIIADVLAYKIGWGADETAGEFFIRNAIGKGEELSILEDDYRRARPASNYDLIRSGLNTVS